MAKLIDVEGIGASYAQKLLGAGLRTTNDLLKKGSTPKGREEIAEKSGVSEKKIDVYLYGDAARKIPPGGGPPSILIGNEEVHVGNGLADGPPFFGQHVRLQIG